MSLGTNYKRNPSLIMALTMDCKIALCGGYLEQAEKLEAKIKQLPSVAEATRVKYLKEITRYRDSRISTGGKA